MQCFRSNQPYLHSAISSLSYLTAFYMYSRAVLDGVGGIQRVVQRGRSNRNRHATSTNASNSNDVTTDNTINNNTNTQLILTSKFLMENFKCVPDL